MKKILIHIGFGKTASTLFQQKIFPQHPEIFYLGGIRAINRESEKPILRNVYRLLRAIVSHDSCRFDLVYWKTFYLEAIYPVLKKDQLNLISEEWLSLTPVLLSGGDQGLIAERLCQVFGKEIKILIVIRNQIDVLNSLFSNHSNFIIQKYTRQNPWSVRHQIELKSFKKILINTEDYGIMSKYKYHDLIKKYKSLFEQNVVVKIYEDFSINPNEFLKKLAEDLEVSHDQLIENMPAHRIKASVNKNKIILKMKTSLASILKKQIFTNKDSFSGLYYGLKSISDLEVRNIIKNYYGSDNRELSKEINVKLSEYGYESN